MKRLATGLLIGFLSLCFATSALAEPQNKVRFQLNNNSYTVNNQVQKMDATTFSHSGRAFVPVRYLASACGVDEKDVKWNSLDKTVTLTLGSTKLSLLISSSILEKNGQPVIMDTRPQLREGRTYLPARWVAEAFGYQVSWDESSQSVWIYPPGQIPTEIQQAKKSEETILSLFKGNQTTEENTGKILAALPNINWSQYDKLSGGKAEELISWLGNYTFDSVQEITYLLQATKGLDGAFAEGYANLVGKVYAKHKLPLIKSLCELSTQQATNICQYIAQSYDGNSLEQIKKDTLLLLDNQDLSSEEKAKVQELIKAFNNITG